MLLFVAFVDTPFPMPWKGESDHANNLTKKVQMHPGA